MRDARFSALVVCTTFLIPSYVQAERLTWHCRVTAVDSAKNAMTLVRKTASGGKVGTCKVAEIATIELNGKPAQWDAVKLPSDATVVYDADLHWRLRPGLEDTGIAVGAIRSHPNTITLWQLANSADEPSQDTPK